MNLSYTEEQVMLREQIQKFCETEYDFYKREEVVKSEDDFDANAWSLFAEQGWLSMPFSEESGGFGFGPVELSILFEEFGKSLVIEPYLSNVVLAGSVLDKSNFEGKVELIENICSGSMHVSLAYAEAAHSYEYLKPDTNVSDGNKLNGTKTLVLNGKNASKVIVSCVMNEELSLVQSIQLLMVFLLILLELLMKRHVLNLPLKMYLFRIQMLLLLVMRPKIF